LSTPAAEPAITAFYVSLLVKAGAFSDAANLIAGMDIDSVPREWKDRLTLSAGEAYLGAGDEEKAEESFLRLLSAGGGIANSAYLYLFSLSMRAERRTEAFGDPSQRRTGPCGQYRGS
jgi:hypothetical protein